MSAVRYKIQRIGYSALGQDKPVTIARNVLPRYIGPTVAKDVVKEIRKAYGDPTFGPDIVRCMKEDDMDTWELYPADMGFDSYRIVPEKAPKKKK